MSNPDDPYDGIPPKRWARVTKKLIQKHPLRSGEIVESVLVAWQDLHKTVLGRKLRIGKDIFPNPQIIGFLLHELIPLDGASSNACAWRRTKATATKQLIFHP